MSQAVKHSQSYFRMSGDSLQISRPARLMIGVFWIALTLLAAIHCYAYTFLGEEPPIAFTTSIYFAAIRWCSWIAFTPLVIKFAMQLWLQTLSTQGKIRKFLTLALVPAITISLTYSLTSDTFLKSDQSLGLLFYDSLLNEVPLSSLTLFAVLYSCLKYLRRRDAYQNSSAFAAASERQEKPTKPDTAIQKSHIVLNDSRGAQKIETDTINRISAAGNYVYIHTQDQKIMHRATMKELSNLLDGQLFVRVHKSHIVNRRYIDRVTSGQYGEYQLTLKSGDCIPLSRNFAQKIRSQTNVPIKQALLAPC